MSATAAFGEHLDSLGIWWPRGDGDGLRELAAAWNATADLIDDITAVLDSGAARVAEHFHGEAADRFAETWAAWSTTDDAHLPATATDCRRLAATLTDFGTDIDVADRTLLRLVEEALAGAATPVPITPTVPASVGENPWIVWLRDCSNQLGTGLDDRVSHHCRNFVLVEERRAVRGPSEVDRLVLTPGAISWPSPGTPIDRSSLATTPVDFGSGEGRPPSSISPLPGSPGQVSPGGLPGQVSITVNGNGTTINVSGSVPSAPPSIPPGPDPDPDPSILPPLGPVEALATADRVPGVTAEPLPLDLPVDASAGGGAGGGGGGGGFGGFGGGFSADAIAMPEPLDFSNELPAEATSPDVQIPIATSSGLTAGAIGTIAGGAAVAATASKGSRPFLPFMPMSPGGTTGDETPEPTRRRRRR